MKAIKGMVNHGQYSIFLRGSREHIRRCVYQDPNTNRFFIIFYDNAIEVKRHGCEFYTVGEF